MDRIRGVLTEELASSKRMLGKYEAALKRQIIFINRALHERKRRPH